MRRFESIQLSTKFIPKAQRIVVTVRNTKVYVRQMLGVNFPQKSMKTMYMQNIESADDQNILVKPIGIPLHVSNFFFIESIHLMNKKMPIVEMSYRWISHI